MSFKNQINQQQALDHKFIQKKGLNAQYQIMLDFKLIDDLNFL